MNMNSKGSQVVGLVGWLAMSYATAAIGAVASINAVSFYRQLSQPVWAPPAWLFGPVWTLLYGLMGISAWLVWKSGSWRDHSGKLAVFVVQLFVNGLWSWLFFAWHHGALAFVDIVVLWVLIAATLHAFWRVRPLAGVLLIPYLCWVSFAMALSFSVWHLNPQILG